MIHKVRHRIAHIGSVEAAELLKLNTDNTRKINRRHVRRLVADLLAGRFLFDGSPIRISYDNVLLDGQHRLLAIVESGVAVDLLIIEGLRPESRKTMDKGGLGRTVGQELTYQGIKNGDRVSAIARLILGWENGERGLTLGKDASAQEVLARGESDLLIHRAAAVSRDKPIPSGPLGFCFYEFVKKDTELAEDFFDAFFRGNNLDTGDPVLALRNRILVERANPSPVVGGVWMTMFIRAWNAYRRNELLFKLQLWKSRENRTIPEIV